MYKSVWSTLQVHVRARSPCYFSQWASFFPAEDGPLQLSHLNNPQEMKLYKGLRYLSSLNFLHRCNSELSNMSNAL